MADIKIIENLVAVYVEKNFDEFAEPKELHVPPELRFFGAFTPPSVRLDEIDFMKIYVQGKTGGETFSEMLQRLISESGEKNSVVYNRANIDRRHFSKIVTHADYKPSKQTVLAFALALKLDFERARDLLAVAGFTLSKASLSDVIFSFFIEYKIFDVDLANQILYKYNQPLLGG